MNDYLKETQMLDFNSEELQKLITSRCWDKLDTQKKLQAVYSYVQNEVLFGYNCSDLLKASEVLRDGYGQCNTKSTLLMALLRGIGIPCRLHGSEVGKHFQRGATSGFISHFAPESVIHTWVEVMDGKEWLAMEGVIIDKDYLLAVKNRFKGEDEIRAYAIATNHLSELYSGWRGESTYVQSEAVVKDFGVFDSPDEFFAQHPQTWGSVINYLYIHLGRKVMNRNVARVRNSSFKIR